MFEWISRLIGRSRRSTTDREAAPAASVSVSVLLWGPAYDVQTHEMARWLSSLRVPSEAIRRELIGPNVRSTDIEDALRSTAVDRQIAIFCGHGTPEALLGPPQGNADDLVAYNGVHGRIYRTETVPVGPTFLFAFCCSSGRALGAKFASLPSRGFLGHDDEIWLSLRYPECREAWKRIVQTAATEIIGDKNILPKHEQNLKLMYDAVLEYFRDGEGRNNPDSVEMQMFILRHTKLIRRYGGPANVSHI